MKKESCFRVRLGENGRFKKLEAGPSDHKRKIVCIYAFIYRKKIIRVGETTTGFLRIRKGLQQPLWKRRENGHGRKVNYYAYKWRTSYPNKSLSIVLFELPKRKIAGQNTKESQRWRRALEAEIAYELRRRYGHWPKAMTEIHFDEKLRKCRLVQKELRSFLKSIRKCTSTKTRPR